jgi:predicted MFS family arabinose efflux permease
VPDRALRLLQLAVFASAFDRVAIAPMLVAIGRDLDVSLAEVTLAATLYYLLYGALQPVWGIWSDRVGRVRVMRLSLVGAVAAGAASAAAPSLLVLLLARAVAGSLYSATIPTALVYVGDTVPIARRQGALADLMGASSFGLAVSTAVAGLAVTIVSWRLVFAVSAVAAALLWVALRAVPEPARDAPRRAALAGIAALTRRPWPVTVIALALLEGSLALGFVTFFAPAVEEAGHSAAVGGGVVALYGVGVMAWTRLVKRLSRRALRAPMLATGASLMALGYAAAAADPGVVGIAACALTSSGGYAFMHSTLQTWATEVAPDLRATTISLFATSLFTGGAIATAAVGPLADAGAYSALFLVAVLVAAPLGAAAVLASRRYDAATVSSTPS